MESGLNHQSIDEFREGRGMKKFFLVSLFLLLTAFTVSAQGITTKSLSESWTGFLKKYSANGKVDYRGFKNDEEFAILINKLNLISLTSLSKEEKLAFYINVYNINVIKLICDYYPVDKITDIKITGSASPFKYKFIKLGKNSYSLDEIENQLIRGLYYEPRIHFALVAGAVSSPELAEEAFTGENLDKLLTKQTTKFLKNEKLNRFDFTNLKMNLNEAFKWYESDFGGQENFRIYISKYLDGSEAATLKAQNFAISFIPYDWNLNDKRQRLY